MEPKNKVKNLPRQASAMMKPPTRVEMLDVPFHAVTIFTTTITMPLKLYYVRK